MTTTNIKFDNNDNPMYSIGDVFKYNNTLYLLAQVEAGKCAMISLKYGNRYKDSIVVTDANLVSYHEVLQMFTVGTFDVPQHINNVEIIAHN